MILKDGANAKEEHLWYSLAGDCYTGDRPLENFDYASIDLDGRGIGCDQDRMAMLGPIDENAVKLFNFEGFYKVLCAVVGGKHMVKHKAENPIQEQLSSRLPQADHADFVCGPWIQDACRRFLTNFANMWSPSSCSGDLRVIMELLLRMHLCSQRFLKPKPDSKDKKKKKKKGKNKTLFVASTSVAAPAQSTSSDVSSSRRSSTVNSSVGQSSAATVESNGDIDSPCVKIPKLCEVDKENIRLLYDRLDKNKMWRLSNDTIVEEKMREFALQMEHEHPSHSLILDVNGKCWFVSLAFTIATYVRRLFKMSIALDLSTIKCTVSLDNKLQTIKSNAYKRNAQ